MALRALSADRIEHLLGQGGLLIDLRPIDEYLAIHLFSSISMVWEVGPGFGGRARDLLPLDATLILLEDGLSPLQDAAERLNGKGFEVEGCLAGGIDRRPPHLRMTSTSSIDIGAARGLLLVDVCDPGVVPIEGSTIIPAERLWDRASEIQNNMQLGILAGFGYRAAAANGILEKQGFEGAAIVRTRTEGEKPKVGGPEMFRIGGPG